MGLGSGPKAPFSITNEYYLNVGGVVRETDTSGYWYSDQILLMEANT